MTGRITSNILTTNYLRNMKRNLGNMKTLQNQLASGKQINKASDNPYIASRSMQMQADISYNKQYNENIKDTSNWLDTTDTALSQIGNVFGRIETLLVSAGNGSYGQDERTSIQDEIKEKANELSQILNTSFDGAYIFGGTKTDSKPTIVDSDGKLQYANKEGKVASVYIDAANGTTKSSISSNNELKPTDSVYFDVQTGKITTSAKSVDGTTNNTQLIPTSTLYLKSDGTVTTTSTGNNQLLLKDNLYVDLKGNVTPSKTTGNTLITSNNEVFYINTAGNVTTSNAAGNILIPTGQTLYKDTSGKVTQTAAGNIAIDAATPLYKDVNGDVTTLPVSINTSASIGSVTGVQLSKYTSGTGYSTTTIGDPYDAYMDSRGVLTDSATTNLNDRKTTLKQLWENSYIDSTSAGHEGLKTGTPTLPNKQIHLYKDSTGQVTISPGSYPANEQILLGTTLYKDTTTGKVTTISGSGTTPMQVDENVCVDLNGDVTTNSTVANSKVSLRDNLTTTTAIANDTVKATIGSIAATDSAVPSDTVTLYVDGSGNISKNSAGTKITLGDSLYLDGYGNITTLNKNQNTLVNSDDKLYYDKNGNVTNVAVNPQITSETTLYKDSAGIVTTLATSTIAGVTVVNQAIDLQNAALYQDTKGNVTTLATGNTSISITANLYKDVNGKVTTIDKNTITTSSTQLYNDGGIVTTDPSGTLAATTQLYKDGTGKVTTLSGGAPPTNTPITTNGLYIDASGNVTTLPGTTPLNTPMDTNTKLYEDGSHNVKTNLIKTGNSMYANSNGKLTTSAIMSNTQLTIDDKIYADATGNLTMASTGINKQITMSDVKSLKNELQSLGNNSARAIEINKIFGNADVAQLAQLDSDLTVDISQGINSTYNKTAVDILEFKDKSGASINVSDLLNNIIKDLGAGGTTSNLTTTHLKDIQSVTANLLQQRSEVGSMQNRMDSAKENNETQNYNMTDILSKTEDIDFAETTMNYSIMQTVYTASLQTSAKILPMTILSYL